MQLGPLPSTPLVSGVQATSAFHLRGLHRQAPFDGREDLDVQPSESDPGEILQYSSLVIVSWYKIEGRLRITM